MASIGGDEMLKRAKACCGVACSDPVGCWVIIRIVVGVIVSFLLGCVVFFFVGIWERITSKDHLLAPTVVKAIKKEK
jgi:hypothetical protein